MTLNKSKRQFVVPRRKPGIMSKTEEAYAQHLELLKKAGEIEYYMYEAIKVKLAPNTFYTPDFVVVKKDMIELHEVKGYWLGEGRVKTKVAADLFWWMRFLAVQWKNKQWVYEEF